MHFWDKVIEEKLEKWRRNCSKEIKIYRLWGNDFFSNESYSLLTSSSIDFHCSFTRYSNLKLCFSKELLSFLSFYKYLKLYFLIFQRTTFMYASVHGCFWNSTRLKRTGGSVISNLTKNLLPSFFPADLTCGIF